MRFVVEQRSPLSPVLVPSGGPYSCGRDLPFVALLPSLVRLPLLQGASGWLWRFAQEIDRPFRWSSNLQIVCVAFAALTIDPDLK